MIKSKTTLVIWSMGIFFYRLVHKSYSHDGNMEISYSPLAHARAVNDRVPRWGFSEKNGLLRSNSRYSKTKRDIVMGPTAKMVTKHKALLAKIWVNLGKCEFVTLFLILSIETFKQ